MAKHDATQDSEYDKAHGSTESQDKLRAYHEGKFQTHDPVTGLPRGEQTYYASAEFRGGPLEDPFAAEADKAQRQAAKAGKRSTAVAPMSAPLAKPAKAKSAKRASKKSKK